jgi:hypothetical protein
VADERVSIVIDVDVKDVQSIAAVQAALTNLNRSQKQNAASMRILRGDADKTSASLTGAASSGQKLKQALAQTSTVAKMFSKIARVLLFTVIAMGIEFAITAASLASINLIFATGRFLVKSYNFAMQGLAGTLAAVGVAALGAAAAFREFTAAQSAFRFKGSPNIKAGIADATGALRNLYADSTLATAGIQALNQAFAAVTKNTAFTPQTQAGLKAMMDFAVASGDTTKGLASAATFLGLIQKESKFTSEALAAAKEIGPEFDKAFKKMRGSGKINTTQDFFDMLTAGELAKEAGVVGAAGIVQQTLFAQFKGYLTRLYGEIASIGQALLNPFKRSLFDIFVIIRRTVRRISGDLIAFGKGGMLDTLVSAVDKISNFSVNLFRKFLPQADGFFGRINKVYTAMYRYTRRFLDVIRPLQQGGKVIIDTFGPPIAEIFKGFGRNIKNLADLGVANEGKFKSFGESLKNVVAAFFEMSHAFKELFTEAIPVINKILGAIALLMRGLAGVFSMFSKMGPLAAFLPVFATLALAMKGRRGRKGGGSFVGGMFGGGGGIPGLMGGGMTGAMAPVQQAGASLQTAGSSLSGASSGLTNSAVQLSNAAKAIINIQKILGDYGGVSQGKMPLKGGTIDRQTGAIITLPRRPPGMSTQEYNMRLAQYKSMQAAAAGSQATPATSGYGLMAQNQLKQQQSNLRLQQRQAAYRASRGFGPAGTSTTPNVGGTVIAPKPPSPTYTATGGLHSIFPKGTFKNLATGLTGGFTGGVKNQFQNFLPNMRTAGQTLRQYGSAMKISAGNRSAKIGAGLGKTYLGLTGSSLMSSAYRDAIAQQQLDFVKGGGDPKDFKAKRGAAAKAALRGNMGVGSMALGMGASYLGSKYGSEEAQGALQAGAGLMTMSPLAGLGVMGLGTAMSAQTTKGGVLSGMAGGAATGALLGSFIPGVGTALGAIVGAGAGAVLGWWKSGKNKEKMRKEARKQISNQNLVPVVKAMINGQAGVAQTLAEQNTKRMEKLAKGSAAMQNAELDKLVEDGVISSAQRERALTDPAARQELFTGLSEDSKRQLDVTTKLNDRFKTTMQALRQATGMTQEEIMALANKMGVNLYDDTLKLEDAITGLGKTFTRTAKELDNAIKDSVLNALDNLEKFKTESEIEEAVRSAQNAFNAGPSMDTIKGVISELTMFLQNKYPNNQAKVLGSIFEMFDPESPNYILGNNVLGQGFGKLPPDKQKEMQDAIRSQFLLPAVGEAADVGASQIGGKLAAENLVVDQGSMTRINSQIQSILKSGDQAKIDKMQGFLKYGNLANMSSAQAATAIEQALGVQPGSLFREGSFTERLDEGLKLDPLSEEVRADIVGAVAAGIDTKPAWWDSDVPDWWAQGLKIENNKIIPADTRTPRRGKFGDTAVSKRLRSTLGAHASMNGMLTGKRTITSAFRTTNLGSMNSDHAAGAAYDLTGQNLGQYAKMVRSGGGFAEFHGVNANRHLHVVPRTGDTSSSRDGKGGGMAAPPNVTVNVYPSQGMDVDALVAKTIRAQEKAMRDIYERM